MYVAKDTGTPAQLDNGVIRTIMAYSDDIMVVRFDFIEGQEVARHQHMHTQSTYILSGQFEFEIDGQKHHCSAGDTLVFPSNTPHRCLCLEAGTLIDNFTPKRDDFLP
ncbi:cupin domain-containing protein [Entomospira culicis]|uniref:Cupin domain-containing protein n=1 Tax=Entomospira culicis TaxID=2719989 RepID=A0A968KVH6_9SPIO|nr:cupin domain-containing protein [Entomospira culicis]NIZ18913.1 cupin domain-containing protein [Entomospira culicis]NIZ69128.1 cupin domain-containing protein [Entomospira culicis]WDI37714.1 cupin domain-containing protein [Entomospira culicis]WDI39342.1 cupin domain-containing protein [Entomospira culicis]